MKHSSPVRVLLGTVLFVVASLANLARAGDLAGAVILVASADLDGTPFAQTVLVAAPLPSGGHMGFIINRPSEVRLDTILPDQPTSHAVVDPVYLGGPSNLDTLFAIARAAPADAKAVVPLVPGLVAVLDEVGIDGILERSPNDARYFVGIFLWRPEQLANEIRSGVWAVKPLTVDAVFRKQPARLWSELRATTRQSDATGSWL